MVYTMVLPKAYGVRRFLVFSGISELLENTGPFPVFSGSSQKTPDSGRIGIGREEGHVVGHVAKTTTKWQQTVILLLLSLAIPVFVD